MPKIEIDAPDRYVITAIARADARDAGKRFWLYWSPEGGGWWQWGPEDWAYRFEKPEGARFEGAMKSAESVGPYWAWPAPATIEVRAVPAKIDVS